MKENFIEL